MDWETPSKEWIAKVARSTRRVAYVTDLLCIDNRELRRLIALYWPDLKPATLKSLHNFLCRTRSLRNCRIPARPQEVLPEPGEPVPIEEPNDLDGLIFDMCISNVA